MPGINSDKSARAHGSRAILKDMQSYVKEGSCPISDRLWELYGDTYSVRLGQQLLTVRAFFFSSFLLPLF